MDDQEEINTDSDLDALLFSQDLSPSFFQSSSVGPKPLYREILSEESSFEKEEEVQNSIADWTTNLVNLPGITQERIHICLVVGKSFDNQPRGALKHKINGYQLFKDGYVKKLRVKDNVLAEKLSFIVKCNVTASMKADRYIVYVHLCQTTGDILYGKCSCKAGLGGCCKHVAAVLYQLVEFRQLNLEKVPDDKTCTDILQQWHVPGEGKNVTP